MSDDLSRVGENMQPLANRKHHRQSVCDVHGDYQEVGSEVFTGSIMWHRCDKCAEIRRKESDARSIREEQERQQEKIERRLNQAGIPLRFREKSFDNFIADDQKKLSALTVARDFVENFSENYKTGRTLIFSGKAGTGKSHLALAIALSVMPKYTALYVNALDAIRMIKDTWRRDSEKSELEILEAFSKVGLLIIDEVGVQYGTENEQMLMFDIINRRYRDSRPMILLTNLGTDGFKEFLSERSYDRLRENGKWVSFDWDSYRGKKM